jgi:hypothetical protein
MAYIGRQVPELRMDLPPNAIGKDYPIRGAFIDHTPSGTGYQMSVFGLLGIALGREEGIELNLLGLNFGVDLFRPALKLPIVGRIGFPEYSRPQELSTGDSEHVKPASPEGTTANLR